MPKQVRIRRGTTAQHATFIGADGEVTFDTTKKVLVLHDGVTAGGKPLDGFIKAEMGNILAAQNINTRLSVTGGNDDVYTFTVFGMSDFQGPINCDDAVNARRIALQSEGIVWAPSIALNFGTFGFKRIDLEGDLSLYGVNMVNNANLLVRLKCDASLRTLTFPAGWHFIGAAAPANIAANKVALLWLWAFGSTEGDVMARYLVEP